MLCWRRDELSVILMPPYIDALNELLNLIDLAMKKLVRIAHSMMCLSLLTRVAIPRLFTFTYNFSVVNQMK